MVAVAVLGLAGSGVVAQEADAVAEAPSVSFSGTADMGMKYSGETKMMVPDGAAGCVKADATATPTTADDPKQACEVIASPSRISAVSNFDVKMTASGTTDGGLTFGATATVKAGNSSSEVGKSNVYIGGESWKIAIGDLDPASHKGQSIGDVGFDGLGVDDVAEKVAGYEGTDAKAMVSFDLGTASIAITYGEEANTGKARGSKIVANCVDESLTGKECDRHGEAVKQEAVWAAGASFNLGSTSLGIGVDSEKLMQASVGADLGAFTGKLFFSQRKHKSITEKAAAASASDAVTSFNATRADEENDLGVFNTANPARTITNKSTGIGVEISVSAGANTTINAVYAQGKQSDTRTLQCGVGLTTEGACPVGAPMVLSSGEIGTNATKATAEPNATGIEAERTKNAVSKTDKAFGIGFNHQLGGGATLQAGFAKVKKQTMASVGVSMTF